MIEGEWRPWFAWRPVEIAGRAVWLRRIERRVDVASHIGGTFNYEHFREIAA